MTRMLTRVGLLLLAVVAVAAPASAQIVHGIHIGGGGFFPRGYDSRVDGDVLNEDLNSLVFKIKDFNGGQVYGEWLMAFGDHFEIAAGTGFYSGGTSSVYRDYTHPASQGSTEIEQDLKLRVVPVTGLVRFLPFGRPSGTQPYVGVGVSSLNYRYSESGEFVDFTDFSTFRTRYVATGNAIAPVAVAGIRFALNGDIWAITTEWRYQGGVGKTGGTAKGFLSDKIDLGGQQLNFGVICRF